MNLLFSAGGIVCKREDSNTLILISQHSMHHGWVFPKGLIDKKETKEQAALREVKEEVGVDGKIVRALNPVTYWYVMSREAGSRGAGEREKIRKTVYYFIMEYVGGDIAKHDHEMEKIEWLPMEKVGERLTYKSDKTVWEEARKILASSI